MTSVYPEVKVIPFITNHKAVLMQRNKLSDTDGSSLHLRFDSTSVITTRKKTNFTIDNKKEKRVVNMMQIIPP